MPALEPGTETRDMDSVDQIDGGLKNIRFSYQGKREKWILGRQPMESATQSTSGKRLNFVEKEKSLQGTNTFI